MEKKPSALQALFTKYHEVIMYLVFGVVTTGVSWVSYSVFVRFLGMSVTLSNALSWILAVLVAFVTNKLWVFDSKSWESRLVIKEAITFIGGRALTGVFEIAAVPILVSVGLNQTFFKVEGLPAKMLVSVAVIILNFVISKFVAFRSNQEPKKPES